MKSFGFKKGGKLGRQGSASAVASVFAAAADEADEATAAAPAAASPAVLPSPQAAAAAESATAAAHAAARTAGAYRFGRRYTRAVRESIVSSDVPRLRSIDAYEREGELGAGAMARVFRARDRSSGRAVALKAFKSNQPNGGAAAGSEVEAEDELGGVPLEVLRECAILRSLRHPNIVQAHEILTAPTGADREGAGDGVGGALFLAMEPVDFDLGLLIEHMAVPFSEGQAKCLCHQLLCALAALEQLRIAHRCAHTLSALLWRCAAAVRSPTAPHLPIRLSAALTPLPLSRPTRRVRRCPRARCGICAVRHERSDLKQTNLLIDKSGVLRLADFGLARPLPSQGALLTPDVTSLWYRAPEVLLGGSRCDLTTSGGAGGSPASSDRGASGQSGPQVGAGARGGVAGYGLAVDVWAFGVLSCEWLRKGEPLLPGQTDLDQLHRTVLLLGAPTPASFPALFDGRSYPRAAHVLQLQSAELTCEALDPSTGETVRMPRSSLRKRLPLRGYDPHVPSTAQLPTTGLSTAGFELVSGCLELDPRKRPRASDALRHRWFKETPLPEPLTRFELRALARARATAIASGAHALSIAQQAAAAAYQGAGHGQRSLHASGLHVGNADVQRQVAAAAAALWPGR